VTLRFALVLLLLSACGSDDTGTLHIRTLAEGAEAPARLEVLGAGGAAYAALDALTLHFECEVAPLPEWLRRRISASDRLLNRETGTEQFYSAGRAHLELPPGRYRVRGFKGIEHRVAHAEVDVRSGQETQLDLPLERWIDMPAEGWYGVDDHVHLTRRTSEDDSRIATWMRAEDLQVANLLQMGTVDQFGVTPQRAFGEEGAFRQGDTLLLAGQEHPRTHFLGHTISLGAERPVDQRETYIVYEETFTAAQQAGGVSGYAHWGLGAGRDGLAIDAPRGLVQFVEVLQFSSPHYDVWYELLDLGARVAATAGTDFPCGPWSVPGAERFYARLPEAPTRRGLVAAVRDGRTFVTNGPLLDLQVGSSDIGEQLRLAGPQTLPIRGRVRFDPERDEVKQVELLRNGRPVPATLVRDAPGSIRVELDRKLDESAWWALRVLGDKVGAASVAALPSGPVSAFLGPRITNFDEHMRIQTAFHLARGRVAPSAAHTGPVWVTVGRDPEAERLRAKPRAEAALLRLDALEQRLSDERIGSEAIWDWIPYSDGVSVEHLRRNRTALLRAIRHAKERYRQILAYR
jgi:hypothetical protein